ncbi:IS630 transposase-related protein [Staphylococcus gallinarum]|uniref:IS630 transposase-related protein n=1 Tax=Staphylococcus gallinarum TaxID=1293 RepID=UPI0030C371F5
MIRWTPEEVILLKKLFEKGLSYADISEFFPDKTQKQTRRKIDYLVHGKNRRKGSVIKNYWEKKEDDFLRDNYNEDYDFLMSKLPKRTKRAISVRMQDLGLKRNSQKINNQIIKDILEESKFKSVIDISKEFGVSRSFIYNTLQKNNITPKTREWIIKEMTVDQELQTVISIHLTR